MAQSHPNSAQSGSGLARLTLGLMLGGLVLLAVTPTPAQTTKTAPAPAGTGVTGPFHHVPATKSQDLDEMSKTLNTRLEASWKANKVTPARFADDYEFIRRASLDIIGRIAKPSEIAKYLSDPENTRRSLLIDRLLASEEYADHWSDLWTNWMLSRAGVFGRGMYHKQMADWLKEQFALNKPYDKMVKELLTAKGKNSDSGNGAVNFILAHVGENVPQARRAEEGQFEMVPLTSRITRLFLGVQVQCAQCHDHPFTNAIKQKHFWGINAFLRQVERGGNLPVQRQDGLGPLELKDNPSTNPRAVVFFEKRNGVVLQTKAEFLPAGEEERGKRMNAEAKGVERRAELADALIEHPNFPKAIVNRMWGVFFGKGLINPIDDFNDNTADPKSMPHPELFEEMSSHFKQYGYDLKKLIRWITHSKAYHLAAVANETNDKPEKEVLFSRMLMKSMSPEQLYKSLELATTGTGGTAERRNRWLDTLVANFGDDEGNEVTFSGTVVQALLLMNGKDLHDAVVDPKGTATTIAKSGKGADAIITELYLASVNRRPSAKELVSIKQKFAMRIPDKSPEAPFQDLFWALLNSNEFILNH
jgi:hypothetical protein